MVSDTLMEFSAKRALLLIIDMQNDFIAKGAPIECPGGRDIIPNILNVKEWAYKEGIPVVYTQESHRKQKVDFGMELRRAEPQHCLEGTHGRDIVKELTPSDKDYVMIKRRYSAYYQTDMEFLLRGLHRDQVIIVGAATNVCVYTSALETQQRDMEAIVLRDCVAGTSPELHRAFLKNIEYVVGDVITSNQMMTLSDNLDDIRKVQVNK